MRWRPASTSIRAQLRRLNTRRLCWISASTLLAAVVGCDEQSDSPTAPDATPPALATASAAALVFAQVSGGSAHTCVVTADHLAY